MKITFRGIKMAKWIDAEKLHYIRVLVQNPNTGKHKHLVAVRASEINSASSVDMVGILNKIITEIVKKHMSISEDNAFDSGRTYGYEEVITIIEKYKAESEGKDGK